ncbi:hypothetical protein KFE25_007284 [Diacronema lutheri]|nr:hypothetical protein KFE25_007284 [Diacronema lutheri]
MDAIATNLQLSASNLNIVSVSGGSAVVTTRVAFFGGEAVTLPSVSSTLSSLTTTTLNSWLSAGGVSATAVAVSGLQPAPPPPPPSPPSPESRSPSADDDDDDGDGKKAGSGTTAEDVILPGLSASERIIVGVVVGLGVPVVGLAIALLYRWRKKGLGARRVNIEAGQGDAQ